MNKTELRLCRNCKKSFELNVYKLGLSWLKKHNRGIFCTKQCFWEYRKGIRISPKSEFKKGQWKWNKHPRFKTGIWSYRQFRKDKCEDCISIKNLDIHHLDGNRNNNDLNNLKTLCHKCHISNYHIRIAWNKGIKTGSRKIYVR